MGNTRDDTRRRDGGLTLARFAGEEFSQRDRLVSMLLQDRGVLRLISAPHGYGKTVLSYEYARRIHGDGNIIWIDGASPEFLRSLDAGELVPPGLGDAQDADLIVLDDLPCLDEERARELEKHINTLLYRGVELIINTLPSNDFLRDSQPDRVLITANDLLVHERDLKHVVLSADESEANALSTWREAGVLLYGHAACSFWDDGSRRKTSLALTGFFEEQMLIEAKQAAFAMILLGEGSYNELERLGIDLKAEGLMMLARDYPFLGADSVQQEFRVGDVAFQQLRKAVVDAGLAERLLKGQTPLCEKCIGALLDKGKTKRAMQAMDVFCSDERCEAWLRECGWGLLDNAEFDLLQGLFHRCREETLSTDACLKALWAWTCGVQGDTREALFYARDVLKNAVAESDDSFVEKAILAAYLCVAAFSPDGASEALGCPHAPETVQDAFDVLAVVVGLCSEKEIDWAFGVLRGGFAPLTEKKGKAGKPEREVAYEALFTACAERCQGELEFRLAMHFLSAGGSSRSRELLHSLGCAQLVRMRKSGIKSFSQAVLLSDLWRTGYFGLDGHKSDARDANLLDEAAGFLRRLARLGGKEPAAIPWESGTGSAVVAANAEASKKKGRKGRISVGKERFPVATVNLFGGMELCVGDRYVPESKWTHRSLQLFSILVLYQGRDVPRELIFQHLWPGLSKTRALDNFYSAWSRTQGILGEGPYMVRRGGFCNVNARYVKSDVAEFDHLARRLLVERDDASTILDIYARMESLYRGGLLPSEVGNSFIDSQRARFRAVYVDSMVAAALRSLEVRDVRVATWFARKAMEEDPHREDVYAALIKAQMASGQRCSAIRTYFMCQDYLREELGLDPSADTQNLYAQLIASDPSLLRLSSASFAESEPPGHKGYMASLL